MYQIILFWNDTLHVLDGLPIHHQQFKTVHTASGICQIDTAVFLLAVCMYSLELLVMDGKTETCTVSFQNKINLIHWCI